MNKLKRFAPLLLTVVVLTACKKDEETPAPVTPVVVTPPLESDHGKVTLTYGSSTLISEGDCTIENFDGHPTITVRDATMNQRTFTIVLTDYVVPIVSATYPLTGGGSTPPAAGTAIAVFEDMTANPAGQWMSNASSGSVTFTVTGSEAVCTVTNLPLQPNATINQGNAAVAGTVSGTFKFDVQ